MNYTEEQIQHIADKECPKCKMDLHYENALEGYACDHCRLFIPYTTYLECKDKEHARVEAYVEELKLKRENKKSNS